MNQEKVMCLLASGRVQDDTIIELVFDFLLQEMQAAPSGAGCDHLMPLSPPPLTT